MIKYMYKYHYKLVLKNVITFELMTIKAFAKV